MEQRIRDILDEFTQPTSMGTVMGCPVILREQRLDEEMIQDLLQLIREAQLAELRWCLDILNDPNGATDQWKRAVRQHLKEVKAKESE